MPAVTEVWYDASTAGAFEGVRNRRLSQSDAPSRLSADCTLSTLWQRPQECVWGYRETRAGQTPAKRTSPRSFVPHINETRRVSCTL